MLIDEPGRDVALVAVSESDSVSSSHIGYVETRSALARMLAGRRLTARQHAAATAKHENLWGELAIVPVDDRVITDAAVLAERHTLRAYDAVHLSSALRVHAVREVAFACWDKGLRKAAASEGLALIPAEP